MRDRHRGTILSGKFKFSVNCSKKILLKKIITLFIKMGGGQLEYILHLKFMVKSQLFFIIRLMYYI